MDRPKLTQSAAGKLATQMSEVAAGLRDQVNGKVTPDTEEKKFFFGTLDRCSAMLRAVGTILSQSTPSSLDPALILLRALIDDCIRVFAVYWTKDRDALLTAMNAKHWTDKHKIAKESAEFNRDFFAGQGKGLMTDSTLRQWEMEILDLLDAELFTDKQKRRFKTMRAMKDLMSEIKGEYGDTVAHAYVLYRQLSLSVHYSPAGFLPSQNHAAILLLDECLGYAYRTLNLQYAYFKGLEPSLSWSCPAMDEWFRSVTTPERPC